MEKIIKESILVNKGYLMRNIMLFTLKTLDTALNLKIRKSFGKFLLKKFRKNEKIYDKIVTVYYIRLTF